MDNVPGVNPDWDGQNPDPATSGSGPYRIFNIGAEEQVELLRYIEVLEQCLGRKAIMEMLPLQPGDVPATYANVDALVRDVGFAPKTPIILLTGVLFDPAVIKGPVGEKIACYIEKTAPLDHILKAVKRFLPQ